MDKFKTLIRIYIVLQVIQNYHAVIAQSNAINIRNSNQPIGGISIERPAKAIIYAKRRGTMNVLIPFEITIIPLAPNTYEQEQPSRSNIPISGSIRPQNTNYYQSNQNVYRQSYPSSVYYPSNNQGAYIPASPNSYQPYNSAQQYNGYRPIIYQQSQYANRNQYYPYAPAYQQPLRNVDYRPWPQYNRHGNTTQQSQNGRPNWPRSNAPININHMNVTHPPNNTKSNEAQGSNYQSTSTTTPMSTTTLYTTTVSPITTETLPNVSTITDGRKSNDVPPNENVNPPVNEVNQESSTHQINPSFQENTGQQINQESVSAANPIETETQNEANMQIPRDIDIQMDKSNIVEKQESNGSSDMVNQPTNSETATVAHEKL